MTENGTPLDRAESRMQKADAAIDAKALGALAQSVKAAPLASEQAKQIRRELETLEEKLRAKVVPGHVLYISKERAADWLLDLCGRMENVIDAVECVERSGS